LSVPANVCPDFRRIESPGKRGVLFTLDKLFQADSGDKPVWLSEPLKLSTQYVPAAAATELNAKIAVRSR